MWDQTVDTVYSFLCYHNCSFEGLKLLKYTVWSYICIWPLQWSSIMDQAAWFMSLILGGKVKVYYTWVSIRRDFHIKEILNVLQGWGLSIFNSINQKCKQKVPFMQTADYSLCQRFFNKKVHTSWLDSIESELTPNLDVLFSHSYESALCKYFNHSEWGQCKFIHTNNYVRMSTSFSSWVYKVHIGHGLLMRTL